MPLWAGRQDMQHQVQAQRGAERAQRGQARRLALQQPGEHGWQQVIAAFGEMVPQRAAAAAGQFAHARF
ncbi:hypothetical protein D3C85_1869060 [compost metagenome]